MALIHCDFNSETLGMGVSMNVVIPEKSFKQAQRTGELEGTSKYPVLYLLHGLSDDHTMWQRRTSVERYAEELGIAVVMPSVHRSFYTNMKHGMDYWSFISEELPFVARALFPLSARREDNFVAGLSMGGYGAFKLALRCPDRFAAAASLSGALDICSFGENEGPLGNEYNLIFGSLEETVGSDEDLFAVADRLIQAGTRAPKLFQCCGTEDFLYQDNLRFLQHGRKLGLELTYEEGPGDHNWSYWDTSIKRVLEWLPLSGR